jgi:hypothetical protein
MKLLGSLIEMQRKSLMLCMLCMLIVPGLARADRDSGFLQALAFGGKLGMNAVTLGGENPGGIAFETTYKLSFAAGGFVNVSLHDSFAIQPEILYVMKGGGRETNGMDRGSWNFSYIEIPIIIHGRYPLLTNIYVYGLFGPELSFLVSAELENENGDTLNVTEDARVLDVGFMFGAGMTWRHSQKGALLLEARYDLGLRSIDRDEGVDAKNRVVSFMVGYQWELGSR